MLYIFAYAVESMHRLCLLDLGKMELIIFFVVLETFLLFLYRIGA